MFEGSGVLTCDGGDMFQAWRDCSDDEITAYADGFYWAYLGIDPTHIWKEILRDYTY